jgi:hypothetical protein
MTEWRPIVGWEGKYRINKCGLIQNILGRALNPWKDDQGYMRVRLTDTKNNKRKIVKVHRLVAEAFIENPNNYPFINHIDNNRSNNCATNLEWCTQKMNLAHMTMQGRRIGYWKNKRSPNSILFDEQVRMIRSAYETGKYSYQKLANMYEVSKRVIGRIVNRETYSDVQ